MVYIEKPYVWKKTQNPYFDKVLLHFNMRRINDMSYNSILN